MKFLVRDFILWLILILVYSLGRLSLLLFYGADKIDLVSPLWVFTSLRFDLMTATYLIIPTVFLSFYTLFFGERNLVEKTKRAYFSFILAFSIFLSSLNFVFFYEYKSQFNQWILGIFYDDFVAIMTTIIEGYPIFPILLGVFFIIILSRFISLLVFKKTAHLKNFVSRKSKYIALLIALPLFILCMRGGKIEGKSLDKKDAIISDSAFLNNLIPSSAYCIRHELKTHFQFLSFDDSLEYFDASFSDIPSILKSLYSVKNPSDIDSALTQKASGSPLAKKPSHIFLILAESHSAWPLYEKYQYKNLMPETLKISKNSLHSLHTLSAGICTVDSVTSILGGIPFAMLSASCIPNYPTEFSIAKYAKALGYKSRFFCEVSLDWCNIAQFTSHIGFDQNFGGDIMDDEYKLHAWGVPDRQFFHYISGVNYDTPTLNVILTGSNHPPYDVDLKAEGCPNDITDSLENKVQHFWYADKQIGDFVAKMRKRFPDALFIITGDHSARLNPPYLGEEFENRMCVPLIFAGKLIEDANLVREIPSASHMDIIPTLVELLAPKDFEYTAFGSPIFKERRAPAANPYSIYYESKLYNPATKNCPKKARKALNNLMALSYWRAVKGSKLPDDKLEDSNK